MQELLRSLDMVVAVTVISCCGYACIGALVPRASRLDPFCLFCLFVFWCFAALNILVGASMARHVSPAGEAAQAFMLGTGASILSLVFGRMLAALFRKNQ